MNEIKYQITQLLFLGLLGFGGYWAITHLDGGVVYSRDNIVSQEEVLAIESIDSSASAGETIDSTEESSAAVVTEDESPVEPVVESSVVVVNSNADLISDLQDIVDTGSIFKKGATGDRVKTVQRFLDVYFTDRDVSADGDFGPGTERLVREFQRAELGGGDGRIGPNTAKKMIETLK